MTKTFSKRQCYRNLSATTHYPMQGSNQRHLYQLLRHLRLDYFVSPYKFIYLYILIMFYFQGVDSEGFQVTLILNAISFLFIIKLLLK